MSREFRFGLVLVTTVVSALILSGCVAGPAISKSDLGNLEINITAPAGVDTRLARIYVDGIYVGNVSDRMPVLHLKRGQRQVRVELSGAKEYQETIEVLGEPNHQVLNVVLQPR